MLNSDLIVKQLLKEARDKTKTASATKCGEGCTDKSHNHKPAEKDNAKEARLKTAALMREMASNLETILPQTAGAKLAADVGFKTSPAKRQGFSYKSDDMGHTPDDPTKTNTKMPEKEMKTNEDKKPGGDAKQDSLTNKSAARVLNKLAGDGVAYATTNAEQPAPDFAGNGGTGFGNELRPHIRTPQAMVAATKRDLKRNYIKEQVGKLFSHVDPEKDTTIKQVITNGAETSKLAGLEVIKKMKNLVNKEEKEEVEEEKVAPGIHEKIKREESATKKLASIISNPNHPKYNSVMRVIKKAEAMQQGVGTEATNPLQATPSAAAQTPPAPPIKPQGCTCQQGMDGQPLCPVCKIQEILKLQQAQQGQAGAQPPGEQMTAPTVGGTPNA